MVLLYKSLEYIYHNIYTNIKTPKTHLIQPINFIIFNETKASTKTDDEF